MQMDLEVNSTNHSEVWLQYLRFGLPCEVNNKLDSAVNLLIAQVPLQQHILTADTKYMFILLLVNFQ